MGKLLICDPVDASAIEEMRSAGIEVDVRDDISQEALGDIIGAYEGIVVRSRTPVRQALLEKASALRVIIRGGVGLDSIDVAYAKSKGIDVRNTPEANSNAVVELVLGMMLTLARHVSAADQGMKAGKWEKKSLKGTEITGKTLGIVGYGRIGQLLGEKARALGMTVVAYDPYVKHPDIVSLDDLLGASDYISVHVPLTPGNRGPARRVRPGQGQARCLSDPGFARGNGQRRSTLHSPGRRHVGRRRVGRLHGGAPQRGAASEARGASPGRGNAAHRRRDRGGNGPCRR